MIIYDSNIGRSSIRPVKHYPPLVVDPDTVKIFQISAQGFQSIPWWSLQIIQSGSVVEHIQFSPSYPTNAGPSNPLPQLPGTKEPFSVSIFE